MVLRASDSSRANTPAELSSLRPVVMKESVIVTPAAAPTSAESSDWLRLKGVGIAAVGGVQRHAAREVLVTTPPNLVRVIVV